MKIENYGYKSCEDLPDGNIPARIVATHRDRYEIICDNGKGDATLKRGIYYDNPEAIYPTIGDFVAVEWNDSGYSRITKTLKRRSCFERLDPSPNGMHEQLVAANFDYVFIMQSLNNNYNVRRLERYLTLAWQSGATPVVVLTKCDLVDNYMQIVCEAESVAIGVDVYAISTKTGEGLDNLKKYFAKGNSIVFLGSSGVGKSTLVNKLAGEEVMTTSEIREVDDRGRHTTTNRELIMLPSGAMVMDTPGMRELGMWEVTDGLDKTFQDIEEYLGMCKYSNCTHTNEPGCAILEAIDEGKLSQDRFNSYMKLKNEARYTENSRDYLVEKKNKFKAIAKQNRNNMKNVKK